MIVTTRQSHLYPPPNDSLAWRRLSEKGILFDSLTVPPLADPLDCMHFMGLQMRIALLTSKSTTVSVRAAALKLATSCGQSAMALDILVSYFDFSILFEWIS